MVDEHDVEALLGRVGHQPLELGPAVGLLPAGVEVAVLADEVEVVLGGEAADRLPLGVGREALALLLGRLAHVGDGPLRWRLAASVGSAVASRSPAAPEPPVAEPAREGVDLGMEFLCLLKRVLPFLDWTRRRPR